MRVVDFAELDALNHWLGTALGRRLQLRGRFSAPGRRRTSGEGATSRAGELRASEHRPRHAAQPRRASSTSMSGWFRARICANWKARSAWPSTSCMSTCSKAKTPMWSSSDLPTPPEPGSRRCSRRRVSRTCRSPAKLDREPAALQRDLAAQRETILEQAPGAAGDPGALGATLPRAAARRPPHPDAGRAAGRARPLAAQRRAPRPSGRLGTGARRGRAGAAAARVAGSSLRPQRPRPAARRAPAGADGAGHAAAGCALRHAGQPVRHPGLWRSRSDATVRRDLSADVRQHVRRRRPGRRDRRSGLVSAATSSGASGRSG